MKRKVMAGMLAAVMTVSVLTACGGSQESGAETESAAAQNGDENGEAAQSTEGDGAEVQTYGAGEWRTYDEPITVTFGSIEDVSQDSFTKMAEIGEPYENNRWVQYFRDEVGVESKYTLVSPTGADYQQQIVLAMTSGQLPDVFELSDMTLYQQLVDAGMIADLTDIYEKEANPTLKEIIEGEGENFLDNYKIDGKLYCVPYKMPSTNGFNYLWVRKDWLDKLGLDIPKTMDDVKAVAKAFVEQDPDGNGVDDTIGLSIDSLYTNFSGNGVFWAFGGQSAEMKYWSTLSDGTVGYSMVQPEMKGGLAWLQDMYKEGLLNPEFATLQWTDYGNLIANNTCGLFYGCHWYAIQMNAVKDEVPEAEWVPILAPGTDGNPAPVYANVSTNGFYCVRSDVEHPEVLVAMLNAYAEKLFGENNDFGTYFACAEDGNLWQHCPVKVLAADVDLAPYRQMKEALDNGTIDELTGVGGDYWQLIKGGDLGYKLEFGPEGSCFELVDQVYPDAIIWNAWQGVPTPTYQERWSGMQEIIDAAYINIIKGEVDVDQGFDAMVEQWNAAGGTDVTAEVNALLSGN